MATKNDFAPILYDFTICDSRQGAESRINKGFLNFHPSLDLSRAETLMYRAFQEI